MIYLTKKKHLIQEVLNGESKLWAAKTVTNRTLFFFILEHWYIIAFLDSFIKEDLLACTDLEKLATNI